MFTVFINNIPLHFCNRASIPKDLDKETNPVYFDMTGGKLIPNCVDMLEKSNRFSSMYLVNPNPEKLFDFFAKKYKLIEAGGGLVVNEKDEILLIYRLETYDLPKGKMEKGETPKESAHREVEEETGVKGLKTHDLLGITFHTYRTKKKKKRILKKTYWFNMTAKKQPLTPQLEEDIEKAEWIHPKDLPQYTQNMYTAIKWMLDLHLKS